MGPALSSGMSNQTNTVAAPVTFTRSAARSALRVEFKLASPEVTGTGTAGTDAFGPHWTFAVCPNNAVGYEARIWADGCTDVRHRTQGDTWG